MGIQSRLAPPEIGLHARRGLVPIFRCLREKLHDEVGNYPGNFAESFVWRHGLPGNVAVHPLHGIRRGKGQRPGQHLIEGDAKRVEIAAGIHRSIHPAGLFRRHVGESALDRLGRPRILPLPGQARRQVHAGEPGTTALELHQDVRRRNVLINEAPSVEAAQCSGDSDGDPQKPR